MRSLATGATEWDHPTRAGRGTPGILSLVILTLLMGSGEPAIAGSPGDLILNEFNAVTDLVFLRIKKKTFLDADVAVADDEINVVNHSLSDQHGPVRLTTTFTLPAGLALGTDYYIVTTGITNTPASDWFGLSLTPGGAKVDITGAASGGTHTVNLPPGDSTDTFFGRVQGNGGNWIELVVIADHLDIRDWTLEWHNADPDQGTVTFESHSIWSDLRSGTIITIRENDFSFGVLPTDLSYDPQNGDWWIHAWVDDFTVVHQTGFKVDDDNWSMRIWDGPITCPIPPSVCTGVGATVLIQDFVGEATPLWGGGGVVAGDEVGKLEQDPSAAAAMSPPVPLYNDGTSSTFGSENLWMVSTLKQDFSALRGAVASSVPTLGPGGVVLFTSLIAVVMIALRRGR